MRLATAIRGYGLALALEFALLDDIVLAPTTLDVCLFDGIELQWQISYSQYINITANSGSNSSPLVWAGLYDTADNITARVDLFQQSYAADLLANGSPLRILPRGPEALHPVHSVIQYAHLEELSAASPVSTATTDASSGNSSSDMPPPQITNVQWAQQPAPTLRLHFNAPTNAPALPDAARLNNALVWREGDLQLASGRGAWEADGEDGPATTLVITDVDAESWSEIVAAAAAGSLHVATRAKALPQHFLSGGGSGCGAGSGAAEIADDGGSCRCTGAAPCGSGSCGGSSGSGDGSSSDGGSGGSRERCVGGRARLRLSHAGTYAVRLHIDSATAGPPATAAATAIVAVAPQTVTTRSCDGDVLLPAAAAARRSAAAAALPQAEAASPAFSLRGVLALRGDRWLELPHALLLSAVGAAPMFHRPASVARRGDEDSDKGGDSEGPVGDGSGSGDNGGDGGGGGMHGGEGGGGGGGGVHSGKAGAGDGEAGGGSAEGQLGAWSLSLWLYLLDGPADEHRVLFFKGTADGCVGARARQRTPSAFLTPAANSVSMRVTTAAASDDGGESAVGVPAERWCHLTFTFDPAAGGGAVPPAQPPSLAAAPNVQAPLRQFAAALYINGRRELLMTLPAENASHNDEPLYIGAAPGARGSRALIAQFRLWRGALSDAAVRTEYARARDVFSSSAPPPSAMRHAPASFTAATLTAALDALKRRSGGDAGLAMRPAALEERGRGGSSEANQGAVGGVLERGGVAVEDLAGDPIAAAQAGAAYDAAAALTAACAPRAERVDAYCLAARAGHTEARIACARLLLTSSESGSADCPKETTTDAAATPAVHEALQHLSSAVKQGSAQGAYMHALLLLSGVVQCAGAAAAANSAASTAPALPRAVGDAVGGEACTAEAVGLLHLAAAGGAAEACLALGIR
ncbi:hypothetical protein JKP88DRAFT_282239 [Tribonema minus]|uniref:Uncharacterized protein n=1 Tax=Tribonema minus TaxID=303371 RepID=A0A835YP64_9STRA|nr:hypothetical protein JKP88DRAFT_282239 [Tribonema minus]